MDSKIMKLTLMLILALAFISCASREAPLPVHEKAVIAPEQKTSTKEAWEEKWESWYKAAKKEGKIIQIGSGEAPPRRAVGDAFQKRYGITVEDMTIRTGLIQAKILAEQQAGLYIVDLIVSGTTRSLDVGAAGLLEPIKDVPILPEVIDPKIWFSGGINYPTEDHTIIALMATSSDIVILVNTNLVKPDEEPKTLKDLLDPKWKGKILMSDPRAGGNALSDFITVMYYMPELGVDFWRELVAKQKPRLENDARMEVDMVAKGKYHIGISPPGTTVKEYMEAGAPVKQYPIGSVGRISSASANVMMLKKSPHPNAAKMLINFYMTREAGYLYSQNTTYQSARLDVPSDHLPPDRVRQPGVNYVDSRTGKFLALKKPDGLAVAAAREIFGVR